MQPETASFASVLPRVVLVTDQIYVKTERFVDKIKRCFCETIFVYIAVVIDPSQEPPRNVDYCEEVISGDTDYIASWLKELARASNAPVQIVALNHSAVLPAIAIRHRLDLDVSNGHAIACDKLLMRKKLAAIDELSLKYCKYADIEEQWGSWQDVEQFVVKPAYGMSSTDVKICSCLQDIRDYARNPKPWFPEHIFAALPPTLASELSKIDTTIVEPFIEGVEFSIDGWIANGEFHAIVQHKLYNVSDTFIGDGITISPPITTKELRSTSEYGTILHKTGKQLAGLETSEEDICKFGRKVLKGIDFYKGVFHIEAKESFKDRSLKLIEVNPRSPGGALWRSAMLRTGIDLELVDALIQLDKPLSDLQSLSQANYSLHYPFYADKIGGLKNWGDLGLTHDKMVTLSCGTEIYAACELGTEFTNDSMREEPYLAFAVASSPGLPSILQAAIRILNLRPPSIQKDEGGSTTKQD